MIATKQPLQMMGDIPAALWSRHSELCRQTMSLGGHLRQRQTTRWQRRGQESWVVLGQRRGRGGGGEEASTETRRLYHNSFKDDIQRGSDWLEDDWLDGDWLHGDWLVPTSFHRPEEIHRYSRHYTLDSRAPLMVAHTGNHHERKAGLLQVSHSLLPTRLCPA